MLKHWTKMVTVVNTTCYASAFWHCHCEYYIVELSAESMYVFVLSTLYVLCDLVT